MSTLTSAMSERESKLNTWPSNVRPSCSATTSCPREGRGQRSIRCSEVSGHGKAGEQAGEQARRQCGKEIGTLAEIQTDR